MTVRVEWLEHVMVNRSFSNIHLHRKDEQGSFAESHGLHLDQALVLDHNGLTDCQPEADTLLVDAFVFLFQFSKALKKLAEIAPFDASASVMDVHDEGLGGFVIGHAHLDEALLGELQGVLDQVDQDLLKPGLVTHEPGEDEVRVLRMISWF